VGPHRLTKVDARMRCSGMSVAESAAGPPTRQGTVQDKGRRMEAPMLQIRIANS
jgi:hypothetical protein